MSHLKLSHKGYIRLLKHFFLFLKFFIEFKKTMEEEVDIIPVINQEIKIEETAKPTQLKNENLKENNKMEISPIIPKLNGDSINKFPQFNEEEFSCSSSETGGLVIDQDAGNSNQPNDIEETNSTINLNNNLKRKSEDDEDDSSSQQQHHQTNNNNFVRHKKMLFTTYPEPPDLIPPVDLFNDVLPTTSNTNSLFDRKVTPTHSEMHDFLKRQQELTRMNDMGKIFGKNIIFFIYYS